MKNSVRGLAAVVLGTSMLGGCGAVIQEMAARNPNARTASDYGTIGRLVSAVERGEDQSGGGSDSLNKSGEGYMPIPWPEKPIAQYNVKHLLVNGNLWGRGTLDIHPQGIQYVPENLEGVTKITWGSVVRVETKDVNYGDSLWGESDELTIWTTKWPAKFYLSWGSPVVELGAYIVEKADK